MESIELDEKFFDNLSDKDFSLYTHDLAPVTPTIVPDLCLATYTPTTAYLKLDFLVFGNLIFVEFQNQWILLIHLF